MLHGVPLYHATMLYAAELLARYGMIEPAAGLLDHTSYEKALTVSALSYDGEEQALDRHFRYWRLRHILTPSDEDVAPSIPPADATRQAARAHQTAPLHDDTDAIDLAARIDAAVRTLARLDARLVSGNAVPIDDAWAALVPLLYVFRPSTKRGSATFGGIAQQRPELMHLIVSVAR